MKTSTINIDRNIPVMYIRWNYYEPAHSTIQDRRAWYPKLPVFPNPLLERVYPAVNGLVEHDDFITLSEHMNCV